MVVAAVLVAAATVVVARRAGNRARYARSARPRSGPPSGIEPFGNPVWRPRRTCVVVPGIWSCLRCCSRDELPSSVPLYWLTRTIGTSTRFHDEVRQYPWQQKQKGASLR